MSLKMFAVAVVAALGVPAMASGNAAGCCEHDAKPCAMACCKHDHPAAEGIDVLLSLGGGVTTPQEMFQASVRQTAVVWFHRPVQVGRSVLMGKYIIEHDTGRQARGEPCTHIYAATDTVRPVATFHCTHLDAGKSERDTVALQSTGDGMQKLVWFQFAGEEAAHGYPAR
jgi:hypothetical protein